MRAKRTLKNTTWGFVYEFVHIICSFILPRLILTSFGSQYNGVTGAVAQFLSVVSLFQAGIGGVTTAALYKPLSEKDTIKISIIVKSTESFMRRVVGIFVILVIVIACGYPFLVSNEFDWFFTASLVVIMSLSTIAQYFFGQPYQFLLNADQHQHIISMVNICKIVASTIISVIMIKMGFGIREVQLMAAIPFVIAPIFVSHYTKKKYNIIHNVKNDNSTIKQRWDNFGQQVANFVSTNTNLVVLSIFSNIYEISVYTVYAMVYNGVFAMYIPLTKGVEAAFGNMLVRGERDSIKKNLRIYEQVVFAATTFLFTVATITIVPFVMLYTHKVTDVDYNRSVFATIMIAATMFKAFRFPYESLTNAAGHFRQTRNPAFIEAAINIILSVTLVFKFGIVGVAIGTLSAYIFRNIRYAIYTSKNIVPRSILIFVKRVFLSAVCLLITMGITSLIPLPEAISFYVWIFNAVIISGVAFGLVAAVEIIFYFDDLMALTKMVKGVLRKQKSAKN